MKGLDSLIRKLDALGGNTHQAVKRGIEQGTKLVEGDAKDLAPVAEKMGGDLQQSISAKPVTEEGDELVGKVSTNLYYAGYVEFGTGQRGQESEHPPDMNLSFRQDWAGMEAQPYLYPAIAQNRETVKELVIKSVKAEIKKLGGG